MMRVTDMAATPDILNRILARKRQEVVQRAAATPLAKLREQARQAPPCRGFHRALVERIAAGGPAVIAEIKKASPSRGVIRKDFDAAAIAVSYARAGAACLSVLTDREFFQGSDADLRQARQACTLPVLRKDFTVDPYQVYETRALGADCILLIAAALHDTELRELAAIAEELCLDVLVEVHNREELERGLMLRTPLLGINNRDLHNFETRLDTTLGLLVDMPDDRTVVTESGIHTRADVQLLRRNGIDAFLVGEAFMAAADPGGKLRELFYPAGG
jgi:indole-3-glycerol phosphate synthase